LIDDDVPGSSRTRQMFGSDNNNRMLLSPLTFNHNTDTVLLDDLQTHQQQQSVAPPNSTSTNPLCMLNQCKLACFLQLGILWWVEFLFSAAQFFSRSSQFSDSLQFFAVTELISTLSPQDSISEHFLLTLRDR
jgi:hypothetical protein